MNYATQSNNIIFSLWTFQKEKKGTKIALKNNGWKLFKCGERYSHQVFSKIPKQVQLKENFTKTPYNLGLNNQSQRILKTTKKTHYMQRIPDKRISIFPSQKTVDKQRVYSKHSE